MLECYFQPKIKRGHEENKNGQPRAKKKRHSLKKKKRKKERIRTRFQKISEEVPEYLIINQCVVTSLIQYSLIRLAIVA